MSVCKTEGWPCGQALGGHGRGETGLVAGLQGRRVRYMSPVVAAAVATSAPVQTAVVVAAGIFVVRILAASASGEGSWRVGMKHLARLYRHERKRDVAGPERG